MYKDIRIRDQKGLRWEKHFEDYTVFDLETCGFSMEDRNSIIELSALKVRNNEIVGEYTSLINPKRPIPQIVVNLTGIDDSMVIDAPVIDEVIKDFLDFIGDDIVVGMNINSYDYNIIYDLSSSILGKPFSNGFVDIVYVAKSSIDDLDSYKLQSICNYFNIDYSGAHRALKDCYLTKAAYDAINDKYGCIAFNGNSFCVNTQRCKKYSEPHYTDETIQLRELQKLILQIIEDGIVTEDEVSNLAEWMEANKHLRGNYPFDRVYELLDSVTEDGIVDENELILLADKFAEFTSPTKSTCNDVNDLTDKHFVLTGEFSYGSKSAVSAYIVSNGGIVEDRVKKCTQFVLIGSLGSQAWKNGVYGDKIKRAMELKNKGVDIELITEEDFFSGR